MSPRASLNRYIDIIDIVRYGMYLVRTYKFLNCYLRVFCPHAKEKSTDKKSIENDVSVTEGGGVGQGNENCYGRTVLRCKRIDHLFLLEKRRQDQGKR
jgi:hypothetical protein